MYTPVMQDSFDFGQSDEDAPKARGNPKKFTGIKIDKPGLANPNIWASNTEQNGRPGTSGLQGKEK